MKCPACSNLLQEITIADVTVDVCKGGCGGIWFDNFELKKFDEPHESLGQALLEIERDESIVIDRTKRLGCPKCDDVVMMRHFFSVKKEVAVDQCPGCGGYWLDYGELGKIRIYRRHLGSIPLWGGIYFKAGRFTTAAGHRRNRLWKHPRRWNVTLRFLDLEPHFVPA